MRFPELPLVLGHRGSPLAAPENTMLAFRLAREEGADGVELDVHPSSDGVPVVIHDMGLERTTDGEGIVAALPWEVIEEARSRGEPVPRLEEAARWAAESGAWLNVEIKSPGVEAAAIGAVEDAGVMERTFFSSFRPEIVARVARLAPEAARFLLTERWNDAVREEVRRLEVHGVCLHHTVALPAALEELAASKLAAVVWTVDDPARLRELFQARVAAVISNQPAVAIGVRREVLGG